MSYCQRVGVEGYEGVCLHAFARRGRRISCLAVTCVSPIEGYPAAAVRFSPSEGTCTAAASGRRRTAVAEQRLITPRTVFRGIPIPDGSGKHATWYIIDA